MTLNTTETTTIENCNFEMRIDEEAIRAVTTLALACTENSIAIKAIAEALKLNAPMIQITGK